MRKLTMITTQYHVMTVIDISETEQGTTACADNGSLETTFPNEVPAFLYTGNSSISLPGVGVFPSSGSPSLRFVGANTPLSVITTEAPYRVIGFYPKMREILEKWHTPEQVDVILDPNTQDQFITLFSNAKGGKFDLSTFNEVDSDEIVANDEIVFI